MTSSTVIDFRQTRIQFNLDLVEKYRVLLGDAVPLPDYETCKLAIEQILTKRGTLYKNAPSIDNSPFGHILWYALDFHDGNGYLGTMFNLSTFKCPMVAKRHNMDASSLFSQLDTLARVLASKDDSLNTNASVAWNRVIGE
jgi:hypothetical protein